ncbi:MAG: AsmA family protein [Acidiferrobacterales bacterium]
MKRIIKSLAVSIGILLLLVAAIAVVLPFIVDPNDYKPEITQAVRQATGRNLTLKGEIKLSMFPWLGLELGEARLSNARGFGKKPFVKVERIGIKVKLLPLLRSQVIVDKIVLEGLQLNLARNRTGVANWDDLLQPKPAVGKTAPATPTGDDSQRGAGVQVGIAGLDVRRGEIRWSDAMTGNTYHVRNLELQTSNLALGKSTRLHVGFDAESGSPPIQTRVDLNGDVLFDLDTQRLKIGKLKLKAAGLTLTASIDGKKVIDAPQFSGKLDLAKFDAKKFLADIGIVVDTTDTRALTSVSLSTGFSASADRVALKKLKLRLDDSTITGRASARFTSAPTYTFSLALNQIDIDRYLPPTRETKTGTEAGVKNTGVVEIPVAMLRELDASGKFRINKLKAFGIRSTDIAIPVKAGNGVITVGPSKARLYKGRYAGFFQMDVRKGAPRYRINEKLTRVQVGPLLKDAGVFDKFSGRGNASAKLTARGLDVDDILNTLNGTAAFRLKNGRIKGLNLYKMVQDAKDAYARSQGKPVTAKAQVNEEMEYARTSGTLRVKNGVVSNNDLKLSGPYIEVTGKGTANLPRQRLNYRLQITISEDRKKGGTNVPVRVYGKLTDPTYSIEWQKILEQEVKKRMRQEEQKFKKNLEKQLQDELRKRLGL